MFLCKYKTKYLIPAVDIYLLSTNVCCLAKSAKLKLQLSYLWNSEYDVYLANLDGGPASLVAQRVKASACNVGDLGLIPGSGRFPGEGNGNPLQYSCLENPIEEPGGLQSTGSQRVGHDWVTSLATAKLIQSCSTLCDPIDGSPPGSPAPGILQARTLEWVAISFSSAWKWKVKVKLLSCVRLLETPWTAAYQAPPPMGFSRQENWSGLPCNCSIFGKQ